MYTCWILIFAFASIVGVDSAKKCWKAEMNEFPAEIAKNKGVEITCTPFTLMSETWVGGFPNRTIIYSEKMQFVCVKMIASHPNGATDNIRGCAETSMAEDLCNNLLHLERLKGKTKMSCHYCSEDGCNSGNLASISWISSILSIAIVIKSIIS